MRRTTHNLAHGLDVKVMDDEQLIADLHSRWVFGWERDEGDAPWEPNFREMAAAQTPTGWRIVREHNSTKVLPAGHLDGLLPTLHNRPSTGS